MKASELLASRKPRIESADTKPLAVSESADPPISQTEAQGATTAVCCRHNGIIRLTGDQDGKVFYCPTGRQYWRYAKRRFWRAMNAPDRGYV
jgi:hypothetical protein